MCFISHSLGGGRCQQQQSAASKILSDWQICEALKHSTSKRSLDVHLDLRRPVPGITTENKDWSRGKEKGKRTGKGDGKGRGKEKGKYAETRKEKGEIRGKENGKDVERSSRDLKRWTSILIFPRNGAG